MHRRLNHTPRVSAGSGVDDDSLSDQHPGIETPKRLQPQEPPSINVTNQESDLIHMGGDENPGTLLGRDQVPESVDPHLIGKRRQGIVNYCPDLSLESRNTCCRRQPLQQIDVYPPDSFRYTIP